MTSPEQSLAALANARNRILGILTHAAQQHGCGALLSAGSLGRGGADAFSDLDLVAVRAPGSTPLDIASVAGDRVLTVMDDPAHAPHGGSFTAVCMRAADTVLWVDWFTWPTATAAVPADAITVFDNIGLPHTPLNFVPFIKTHPAQPPHREPDERTRRLAGIAVAAKYLARNNTTRLRDTITQAATVPDGLLPDLLHRLVNDLGPAVPGELADRTRRLITLAEHHRTTLTCPQERAVPGTWAVS